MTDTPEEYKDSWNEHDLNNSFIDWQHWVHRMKALNSEQASLLLNGLDPNLFAGLKPSLKHETIDLVLAIAMNMKSLADSQTIGVLAPTEWQEWAEGAGFNVHSQFKSEVETLRRKVIESSVTTGDEYKQTGPQPLTTSEIAECFCGFKWKTSKEGRTALGKKPAWLKGCIASPGIQGRLQIRWYPVELGAKLVVNGYTSAQQIRSRFRSLPRLEEWLELWKDYEADYLTAK